MKTKNQKEAKIMSNVIDFKKVNREKIMKQYDLEGCEEDLVDLAAKLLNCDPSRYSAKKKEESKAGFIKKAEEQRGKNVKMVELSDKDLDSAAGGVLLRPLGDAKDPLTD